MSVLEVQNLTRHYQLKGETVHALNRVSLQVTAGEFLAVAGPSGSGKTTLLNHIGALDKPTEGKVLVDGQDLAGMSGRELATLRRERIGFIFQSYNLIPVLSALENVEYVMLLQGVPAAERRQRAHEVLEEVGLHGLGDRRPAELSGGQQQRVAVARAIVSRPAIVLADEPTANLDSQTATELLATMAELNREKGITFLFSSHDQRVLDLAHRLIWLVDGRIDSDQTKGS